MPPLRTRTELFPLKLADFDKWVEVIRIVVEEEGGNLTKVAKSLRVSRRQVYRMISQARLWSVVYRSRRGARLRTRAEWGNLFEVRKPKKHPEPEPDWLHRTRKALQ